MKLLGLIPARSGSKRVIGKNVRPLLGHPLLAYTIQPALLSGIFTDLVVSTDSPETAEIAKTYGANVPFLRPAHLAEDLSPDITWILHALTFFAQQGVTYDAFAILRPTSPFRTLATFQRARTVFAGAEDADSLRAVEDCRQHPGKMWTSTDRRFLKPLLDDGGATPPWHSSATQSLPHVLAQNASFEMAWTRVPLEQGTISGKRIIGFHTEGFEGFDINRPEDFILAEALLAKGYVVNPFSA